MTKRDELLALAERLTGDELIFARRMLPHFLAGKSPLDAARAVLDDDTRILNMTFANNRSGVEAGIVSELSLRVYRPALRAAAEMEG